eukprot:CAMPEP_0117441138 /NCGR_PEP_ID=MMETSP0759-20121206/3477_1 /TAXON_ID=63605 /ORGANISM="Percolomonas cosmopolitus, Strain WS" /LENGTH=408 /DNA_ID=CAMNT_0005232977 /DNA_START=38 /DNA_END=1264 /DNA_ORIENTATION=+
MSSSTNKLLLSSILSHLQKSAPHSSSTPIPTSQILAAFNLAQSDLDEYVAGDERRMRVASLDLEAIFEAGVKIVEQKENEENSSPEFVAFINALTSRGYFKDSQGQPITKNSPAYNERFQKAKLRFKQKEGLTKQEGETHKNEGNELMRQKKYDEAIEAYKRAIQCDSSNAIYFCNMAAAYSNQQRYDEALEAAKKSFELDPKYSKAALRIGMALEKQNKTEEAHKFYKKALALEPDNEKYQEHVKRLDRPLANPFARGSGSGAPSGFPGMPDLSAMRDMFGGQGQGGMPDMSQMGDMFNNPQFMEMAQNLMQNDQFKRAAESMMQGMGFDPSQISESLVGAIEEDEEADNEKVQEMLRDIRTNGPEVIERYHQDPELKDVLDRARDRVMQNMPGISEMAQRYMGGGQ